ncbi:hypothetical protein AAFF_G00385890 [Aldrovandia affinis]|uniref:Homeobox domain-containing protein n=1 Tax=Aldrovandia affinis TaxID=143900 RepID=A0AAD7SFC6_9TELE|nr:hypothetical protein AAFF_G00385890 [Aldrovandia affinis]
MALAQPVFLDFFPGKNTSMLHGYQTAVLGCPPAVPPVTHLPAVDAVPWIYPGFQGYHFIPYPNFSHSRHMKNTDLASPCHLLGRVGGFFSPYQPVATEDPSRVAKAATRESTSPLRAWLNEHVKNPYPTKGEKIMLAIVTKMSLTQVSTWFANARRRLKKENKMNWTAKGKTDEEDEESEEEGLSQKGVCFEEEEEIDPQTVDETGDASMSMRLTQRLNEGPKDVNESNSVSETNEETDCAKSKVPGKENSRLQKPKIWSLAETAISESDIKDPHRDGGKSNNIADIRKCWSDWASRHGQYFPYSDSAQYLPKPSQFISLNIR